MIHRGPRFPKRQKVRLYVEHGQMAPQWPLAAKSQGWISPDVTRLENGPLIGAVASLVAAGLYAYVGRIMLKRQPTGEAQLAMRMFATWWFALGALTLIGSTQALLAAFGVMDLQVHQVLSLVNVLPLTVALWALLYYLLYLHLGTQRILVPLTIIYAAIYAYFVFLSVWLHPIGVETTTLGAKLIHERTLTGGHLWAIILLLLGPATLAAFLYGSLFFRLTDRVHRYRIALVSLSFILWFGGFPILGIMTGLNEAAWWPIASRALSLIVPILIIAAYEPPRQVKTWLDADARPERS